MDGSSGPWLLGFAASGVVAGLFLLGRGLAGYRAAVRVGDTGTSPIGSLAAGEVRVGGVVEPAEMTLISLLQSAPCVYYRATVGNDGNARTTDSGYADDRSIGFRVRDDTGSLRVFPRGARLESTGR
ncbi:MAG: hypothetical protein ABI562_02075 [Chloroflexota bacterium]